MQPCAPVMRACMGCSIDVLPARRPNWPNLWRVFRTVGAGPAAGAWPNLWRAPHRPAALLYHHNLLDAAVVVVCVAGALGAHRLRRPGPRRRRGCPRCSAGCPPYTSWPPLPGRREGFCLDLDLDFGACFFAAAATHRSCTQLARSLGGQPPPGGQLTIAARHHPRHRPRRTCANGARNGASAAQRPSSIGAADIAVCGAGEWLAVGGTAVGGG
jgi:hypothetical protein